MEINYEELDKKANPGAFSTFDAEIFVPEIQKLGEGDLYLEVGVDKGKSLSIARMVSNKQAGIVGVDLREDPNISDTIFFQGDSVDVANKWDKELKISILFIDGDHSYQGCKRDIEAWFPYMKEHGIILFHDCDESSPGVVQAVAEFVNTHTIDKWELFKRTDKNTSISKIQL